MFGEEGEEEELSGWRGELSVWRRQGEMEEACRGRVREEGRGGGEGW